MLAQFEWWHGAFLILAVVLEIVANIFLKCLTALAEWD